MVSKMNIEGFIRSSKSFSNFFEKAKSLTSNEKGDVFERLVELYLQSKPKYATVLKNVWIHSKRKSELPEKIRTYLNLPVTDEGIDLIAEHVDGTFWAV